jgi:hypothetical protein
MFRDLFEDRKDEEIEFPPNGTSLDLLQAIYRCPAMPLHTRMRAAMSCLAHEHPKLGITYQATETDFANLLNARIKRYQEKLIEHQPSAPPAPPPYASGKIKRRQNQ